MNEKKVREEAVRKVMWYVGNTNNDVTRYIADAVVAQSLRDECGDPRWIPVIERLPELHRDVLVAVCDVNEDDASTFIDCLVDNNDRPTWSTYNGALDRVLAWMPLPDRYRPEMKGEKA